MEPAVDVATAGSGVIGCSIAYHAARRGARVALVEAEQIGSGAAAAGMLNAQAEAQESGPFLDLLLSSRRLHGSLGEELYEATGLDPEYVWAGTLASRPAKPPGRPSPPSTPGSESGASPPGGWTRTRFASWSLTSPRRASRRSTSPKTAR